MTAHLPGHRDFAVGLPATTALLRLPWLPGPAAVRARRPARRRLAAAAGPAGEPRHRLDLDDRADLRRPAVVDVDAGAAPGGSGRSPADLDGIRRAAYLWGLGDAAVGAAVRRARERHQFGVPIGRHQAVAFPLAALTARLRATRLLIHSTAAATGPAVARDPAVAVAADPAASTGPAVARDPAVAVAADPAASIGPAADDEDKRPFTERVARLVRHTGELALDATWCALHLHGAHGLTDASPAQLLYRRALFHTALLRSGRHPHPPYSRRT
ncbi:acyl-CoA dehydrogenase family protein [Streptomyces shaanxiensis]